MNMYYYAYLDDRDIVTMIIALPSQITDNKYISIPSNDQTLIGKRYNRNTGEFEDVILFYYAVLGEKDIVTEVISSETEITDPNKILIQTNDTSLIGKWYNRQTGQFLVPPIHILAELDTRQINVQGEDKWLQTELDEINEGLADARNGNFGGYKCSFEIKDNQETTAEWTYSGTNTGKRYTFNFDTGIPGYFPKMIRLVDSYFSDDILVAEFYIVKNSDGTIKRSYVDKNYLGIPLGSGETVAKKYTQHDERITVDDVFRTGRESNGRLYDEGGSSFFQKYTNPSNSYVSVGYFSYTENSFSFTLEVSQNLIGYFTSIDITGYVF
ncbi:hypothetical protein [Sinanaerobacter chloroacetimidivorans]|uniref:Uncharacterized protein n=1 Tax=Sinanaerobacter chloroacetimidivorans TaxID=2818044 RepID=A0A8J7W556_9FIRM|nr:hypothetical protein [Sinanaerobacter chloroacetimidivorans]MBR0599548.1 hypothetical protein [Sinanaerobacter chloroacetimidivorans]